MALAFCKVVKTAFCQLLFNEYIILYYVRSYIILCYVRSYIILYYVMSDPYIAAVAVLCKYVPFKI